MPRGSHLGPAGFSYDARISVKGPPFLPGKTSELLNFFFSAICVMAAVTREKGDRHGPPMARARSWVYEPGFRLSFSHSLLLYPDRKGATSPVSASKR